MEQVLQLVMAAGNPENPARGEAEGQLLAMRAQHPVEFAQAALGLIQAEAVPGAAKHMCIILLWQMFPEEIEDLPEGEPHPFDVLGEEIIGTILTVSCQLLLSGTGLAYHAATLFGIVGCLQIHRSYSYELATPILTALTQCNEPQIIIPAITALAKFCVSAIPEAEEVSSILTVVVGVLERCQDATVGNAVMNIVSSIIENNPEFLCDEAFLGNILQFLMSATINPLTAIGALTCWDMMSDMENGALFLLPASTALLQHCTQLMATAEDPRLLCAAANVLTDIAVLCTVDGIECTQVMHTTYEPIVMAVIRVISSISNPEWDDSNNYEPAIEAYKTLKQLAIVFPDEILIPIMAKGVEMLGSPEFNTRFTGMTIIRCIVEQVYSHEVILGAMQPTIAMTNDPAPRVRQMAFKCLKQIIIRATQEYINEEGAKEANPLAPRVGDIAGAIYGTNAHLSDVPHVAWEVARVFAHLASIPAFPETDTVLKGLRDQAVALGTASGGRFPNPFACVDKVIDNGDATIVCQHFPAFVQLLGNAVTVPGMEWLIYEMHETFHAYLIRFGEALGQAAVDMATIMIQIAKTGNEFVSAVMIALGIFIQKLPAVSAQFLPDILGVIMAAFQASDNDDLVYGCAQALIFIARAGDLGPPVLMPLYEALLYALGQENLRADSRRSIMDAIAALAASNREVYAPVAEAAMGKVRTFYLLLDVLNKDDKAEASLTMLAMGRCLLETLIVAGPAAINYMSMAQSWLTEAITDSEEMTTSVAHVALDMIELISVGAKNEMLKMIQEESDIGTFVVSRYQLQEDPGMVAQAQKILTILGYSEE